VKEGRYYRLETTENAVIRPEDSVALEHRTLSISVQKEGQMRFLIIDPGTNISILNQAYRSV
jgi:hypothetical protein